MRKTALLLLLLALSGGLLSACAPAANPAAATSTPALPPTPVTVLPTAAPLATDTPAPGRVVLLGDGESLQAELNALAGPAGLRVEALPALDAAQLTPDVRVVVAPAAPANLAELLGAAPQTQFVVFSGADLPPAANLTVIRRRPELQAFAAGFLAALLSPDFRAAGLLPSDGPLGALLPEAFFNGGRYYCGTCAPGWPLNFAYPAVVANPSASDGATWQAGLVDAFDNKKVDVVYLSPEAAAHPEIQGYLQGRTQFDRTLLVVGAEAPPDLLQSQWAASVSFDDLSALRTVWPEVQAGRGGEVIEAPLALAHINPARLEAGRLRLVEDLLKEIAAGRVYPFTVAP